ncbi:cell division protein SepF [Candidatus Woesearchaeota archaeon]|nr:cell division protein SepF [Candidatus Woesearchaeota archaeon]
MGFFDKLKEKLGTQGSDFEEAEQGYVELGSEATAAESRSKLMVRPFVIEEFEHIKPILDALREGHTIALINIKPLKDKDLVELKRAINKLKKTCDALEGDIAGFGENWIAAVPSFAYIYRGPKPPKEEGKKAAAGMEVTEYEE